MTPTLTSGCKLLILSILPLLVATAATAAATAATAAPANPVPRCTGENTIKAYVVALDQVLILNRFGSTMPGGMIYALARDVFPKGLKPGDYSELNSCRFAKPLNPKGTQTCTAENVQLRPDTPPLPGKRPRPLVLRANEKDCLEIHFANLLSKEPDPPSVRAGIPQPSTRKAGVHVQGLNWVDGPQDDASEVGANKSSLVDPDQTAVYWLYAEHEGAYLLYSTADDWTKLTKGGGDGGTLAEGLFGAVNIQPSHLPRQDGSTGYRGHHEGDQDWHSEFYRSQVTEQDLCLASTDKVLANPLHCARRAPETLPTIDYQARYPTGHPRANLPILNMVCSNRLTPDAIDDKVCEDGELVHGDLTAVITGTSSDKDLPKGWNPQPQMFPHSVNLNEQPPSLRPIYTYPGRFQPFREFTVIYHESFQVTQAFSTLLGDLPSLAAAQDNFGINYGMAGLSNEVLANRLGRGDKPVPGAGPLQRCVDCKFEEFFLSSWAMGDPAMNVDPPASSCTSWPPSPDCSKPRALYPDDPSNVYHAYMSDHVRFRVLHAGADLHHLHHQHAQQWLGTPNSPDGDYLDSQSIGPGSAFTMEMVYNGSGNVNQTVGDSIFHCHFYPHFASGMWSLWRVHDVFEGGTILGDDGRPCDRPCKRDKLPKAVKVVERTRALPDGEIQQGTPTVALVPLPTLPMAPMPAAVRLQGVCKDHPATNCLEDKECGGAAGSCTEMGSRYCVVKPHTDECVPEFQTTDDRWDQVQKGPYRNPGYPFFIPGIGGSRPPHPPLDFAYACSKSGKLCDPALPQRLTEAVAQEAREHLLTAPPPEYQSPIFEDCRADEVCEPMDGGLPRAVTAQGPRSDWRSPQNLEPLPPKEYRNLDFSKEIETAQAIELPETGTLLEKVAMATHAERFHYDTQLPDGRTTGTCSDNKAPCLPRDLAQCGSPERATCREAERINFVLNGLPPQPGAPYADPCIRFDRNGGQPANMLTRAYLAADIQLDAIFNREGWHFPQQRILSLWGDVKDFLDRKKPPEPLFMRVNSYDCMTYVLANLVPNVYEQDDFQVRTPTDVIGQHIHLVKFDVTSSDGAENGWNYEDGTYGPNEVTERIRAINSKGGIYEPPGENEPRIEPCKGGKAGQRCLEAKYIKFFGPGPGAEPKPSDDSQTTGAWLGSQATVQRWYDDPLFNNTGLCSTDLNQGCSLGQELAGIHCPRNGVCVTDAGWCLDAKNGHANCTQSDRHLCCTLPDANRCESALALSGSFDPAYFSSCEPIHDRTIRTVFTHDHFGPSTHQQAGLYGGVVAEPKGSIWRDNQTGEIMGGFDAAANENYALRTVTQRGVEVKDGGPTSWQAVIETPNPGDSFREFLLEVQDSTLLYAPFTVGGNPFARSRPGVCKDNESEPCGFCSLTGRCSNDLNTRCQVPPFGGPAPASGCTGGTCLFGLNPADASNPYLVACTPSDRRKCWQQDLESCNFIPGIPSTAWIASAQSTKPPITLGGPIDINLKSSPAKPVLEAITFQGSTNSFSFNYRDEPLYPRIDSPPPPDPSDKLAAPTPMAGARGDLAFAYSSLQFCQSDARRPCTQNGECGASGPCVNRPNPRGFRCSLDLDRSCAKDCPITAGECQEVGFCSDNFALCTQDNRSLCDSPVATCLARRTSVPYQPLTAGIEDTDPFTPLLRGYAGDDVQLRVLIGAHINPHNFTLHGLNWLNQPSYVDSGWRNSQVMGISEHYNLLVKLDPKFIPPTGAETSTPPLKPWMDYLYQPGAAAIEQAAGNWGLIRAYDERRKDLWPLPQNNYSPGKDFKKVSVCPPGAPSRDYTVMALTAAQALGGALVYNANQRIADPGALLFFNREDLECTGDDWSTCGYKNKDKGMPDPLVLRAAAGDCIHITLQNGFPDPSESSYCSKPEEKPTCFDHYGSGCGDGVKPEDRGTCQIYGYCSNSPAFNTSGPFTLIACKPDNSKIVCNGATCLPLIGSGVPSAQLGQLAFTQPAQAAKSNVSLEVGLRPQLVTFDSRFSDGTNAGFNAKQTAAPRGTVKYTWYAGHIVDEYRECPGRREATIVPAECDKSDPLKSRTAYIPIEFGASNLLPPDPLNHALHGLFGALIIEPKGATWKPAPGNPDSAVNAYVHYSDYAGEEHDFYEFVVFTSDDTRLAKLTKSGGVDLLNYSTEVLRSNGPLPPTPATPTFTAQAGKQVRFRLLHPGGTNTNEVFEVAGHTFLQTPYETPLDSCNAPTTQTNLFASQYLGEKNLCGSKEFLDQNYYTEADAVGINQQPFDTNKLYNGEWSDSLSEWKASRPGHGPSNHFDVFIHEAGGPFNRCGDYLYRSYPADHFNLGVWGIFRVGGCSQAAGAAGER